MNAGILTTIRTFREAMEKRRTTDRRSRKLKISRIAATASGLHSLGALAATRVFGAIAQLGERLNGIQEVGGSIPPGSTR